MTLATLPWPLILAGTALILSALAAWHSSRSFPASIHRVFKRFKIDHEEFRSDMEDQHARMSQNKVDMTALYESVDQVLGTIEKKRRSAAASESRSTARTAEPEAPVEIPVASMNRLELERLARSRGMI